MTKTSRRREVVREKNKKKRTRLYILIGAGVAVVAVIVAILLMLSTTAELPEGVAQAYPEIEQDFDDSGFPRMGRADAPITVVEYSSFGCPACKSLHEDQLSEILDSVRDGHVQVIFKPITSIANNANNDAEKAARAAICAGDQGRFWEMHNVLFHWQGTYSVNTSRIKSAAEEIGIDSDALSDCYNSNRADSVIVASEREFRSQGFNSTPRVVINGQEVNWGAMSSTVENEIQRLGLDG